MRLRSIYACVAFLSIITLSACNGSSGANGANPFTPDTPSVITLDVTILDAACASVDSTSFEVGTDFCIQASLLQDGTPFAGQIITFSTELGELSAPSKLTDATGVAQISLDASDVSVGAGAIVASFDELSDTANFEFISSNDVVGELDITLGIFDNNNNPVTRFRNDRSVTLRAVVTDANGLPLANEIVSFQVTSGELSITDALTNEQGIAETILSTEVAIIGAATATVTYQNDELLLTDSTNYEIQLADTINQQTVRFGYFDSDTFIENVLGFSNAQAEQDFAISAGATLGISVGLADENDQPIATSTPISFSSRCVSDGQASLDATVNTINGIANATYEDISCATGSGNQDQITASVNVDGVTLSLSRTISLQAENIGSIEFISAAPDNIVLQGTGGQGSQSVSVLTFQVNGAQGNPLSQQNVSFTLNTNAGGLSISPLTGLTNSQGQVSTRVTAGSVPTSVRVTATVEAADNQQIQTQSDLLSVNTGLPDQNSFSLSSDNLNPEAFNISGETVTLTARLADTFNNPVPDGTAVSFTAEGGNIQPSCTTTNGACSVTWTSSEPRADDHRVTILATAIGHETLVDSNGNNLYDDEDGSAISSNDGSGYDVVLPTRSGFVDLSEAWRDDNENRQKDANEIFLDFDSSGAFSPQNGLFDGPQCDSSSCGASSLHVRRALTLITSSSSALIAVSNNGSELANNQSAAPNSPVLSIARGGSASFVVRYSDTAIQPIASGSSIEIAASSGTITGTISDIMPISNQAGSRSATFTLINSLLDTDASIDSAVTITITSPSGVVSELSFAVTLL